ncbi:caspase family protein [Chryseobacterium sp.]|uniref:caspase family protein n=1 Tax=Chryseobacterium sp. TaxID=1871047 RepID=UPI002606F867|nr:caspase family protein [Chryseobacterium sp.]
MKKKILLIGNTDGLPGVKIDVQNYKAYFKSNIGGNWHNDEIIEKIDAKKTDIISTLENLKNNKLDYLIIIFSGHGGMQRSTLLAINPEEEVISELELNNICDKQVTILDCCRVYPQNISESIQNNTLTKSFSVSGTRAKFEHRILQASPQQIKIYSCAPGESSYDTPEGGAYTKHLLETAYSDTSEFIYFGRTHEIAAKKTTSSFASQNPEIIQPRLLSASQLIFGIN